MTKTCEQICLTTATILEITKDTHLEIIKIKSHEYSYFGFISDVLTLIRHSFSLPYSTCRGI